MQEMRKKSWRRNSANKKKMLSTAADLNSASDFRKRFIFVLQGTDLTIAVLKVEKAFFISSKNLYTFIFFCCEAPNLQASSFDAGAE